MSEVVRDVTDAEFPTAVLERSKEIPVVIDLWAPWCGPCRQLAPVLEKIANDRAEEFELVKLNIDENPEAARLLGARSIPLVVGFRAGSAVSHFLGVQTESAINEFIDSILPSQADQLVAEAKAKISSGESVTAERLLKNVLELDPRNEMARISLARLLAEDARYEQASEVLSPIAVTGGEEVTTLLAVIKLNLSGSVDLSSLEARLQADATDLDAAVPLGKALGAKGEYERALELLLDVVKQDAAYQDGAAKQVMLDIFNVLGAQDPVTKDYRTKLSIALF